MKLRSTSSTVTFSLVSCAQSIWVPVTARHAVAANARRIPQSFRDFICSPEGRPDVTPSSRPYPLGSLCARRSWLERNFPATVCVSFLDRGFQLRHAQQRKDRADRKSTRLNSSHSSI